MTEGWKYDVWMSARLRDDWCDDVVNVRRLDRWLNNGIEILKTTPKLFCLRKDIFCQNTARMVLLKTIKQ